MGQAKKEGKKVVEEEEEEEDTPNKVKAPMYGSEV